MPISCRAAAKGVTIACLLGSLVLAPVTEACTRILRNTSTFAVFV